MAKAKTTAYFCQSCGYESSKWMGQCPACREWNTFVEEPVAPSKSAGKMQKRNANEPVKLSSIEMNTEDRVQTGIHELDRVLGGGIVAGSLILVGGDPGIGKSTLLLQVCQNQRTCHDASAQYPVQFMDSRLDPEMCIRDRHRAGVSPYTSPFGFA